MSIVSTNKFYTTALLYTHIRDLLITYPFLQSEVIGHSVLGNPIPYIRIGVGNKSVFYSASIHANESITTNVLMKFIEDFCIAYTENTNIYGISAKSIFKNSSIYIVPLCNPDGVNLVNGYFPVDSSEYIKAQTISNNYPAIPFPSGWKANINGVDLNLQFPAGWEESRRIKFSQGFISPAPRDFVGFGPLTEPESLALYDFTLRNNFGLILAYHTQGKEIYWQFQDYAPENAEEIGNVFATVSGYKLADVPYISSFAGYKDWFLQQYRRPGYTIEAGIGENPLPISQFDSIYNDNIGILVLGAVL